MISSICLQVFILWSLNLIAIEIDEPFGRDTNDIDGDRMQDVRCVSMETFPVFLQAVAVDCRGQWTAMGGNADGNAAAIGGNADGEGQQWMAMLRHSQALDGNGWQ